jgi:protein-S-isoprenylcysteine O-methyltransferase Ste14
MILEQISYYANLLSFVVVIGMWLVFAGTFLLGKKPQSAPDTKREPSSWFGIILQGLSFGIVWAVRRTPFASPFVDGQDALNIGLQAISIALAIGSIWLASSAVRELGKQWSLQARLIEGHKLVTSGVYSMVRHPIYTAMFGMLIATALAFSHWIGFAAAVIVFLIGTKIRTRVEEKLLAEAFGTEFESWKAKVPALIPFLKF